MVDNLGTCFLISPLSTLLLLEWLLLLADLHTFPSNMAAVRPLRIGFIHPDLGIGREMLSVPVVGQADLPLLYRRSRTTDRGRCLWIEGFGTRCSYLYFTLGPREVL